MLYRTTLCAAALLAATPAFAFDVKTPYVEKGILEIESKNRFDFDHRSEMDNFRQNVIGVGYGVTNWWSVELEGEWEKESGHGYSYNATEIENKFQLTEQGEYWLDAGLQASYEFSHETGGADEMEIFALLAKKTTQFTHVANLGVVQEVGGNRNRNPEFEAKWMTQYNWKPMLNPGFEYYGSFGEFSDFDSTDEQKHRVGPVIYGQLAPGVKYELGWLFGITKATEDQAVKLNIEYEFPL